jgi:hypothetical protein
MAALGLGTLGSLLLISGRLPWWGALLAWTSQVFLLSQAGGWMSLPGDFLLAETGFLLLFVAKPGWSKLPPPSRMEPRTLGILLCNLLLVRMLLDDDPADWRERPASLPPERIQAFNARASQNEALVGRTIYSAGFTWPGVMYWDDVRTVDYLLTRPDVDPGRIGCVGLSVGAVRSAHLAALDERIKAAVVVCWMTSFRAQLEAHVRNTIGHTKVVPGLYRELDYPDVASLAMPRPLLVINGTKDGLFAIDGVQASFDKLNACYAKAGVPEHCRTRFYETRHEFNAEMQAEAWAWFERFL